MVQVWVKYDLNWTGDRTNPVAQPLYHTSISGYSVPVYIPWAQPWYWPDEPIEFIVTPEKAIFGNYLGGVSGLYLPEVARRLDRITRVVPLRTLRGFRFIKSIPTLRRPLSPSSVGDSIRFEGYGAAAEGATLVQIGATNQWQIHSGLDGHNEVITSQNNATIHASDYLFV